MEQLIKQAIANKNLIEFIYGNHLRLIEPHVLGVKSGTMQVLGYQIGGSSNSGNLPEWRRFDLPKISQIKVSSISFPGRRPYPSGQHSTWDKQISIVS